MSSDWVPTHGEVTAAGRAQEAHHAAAAAATRERFGSAVFLRAVVEASNFCRENCHYCGMRRDHRRLDRYRARLESLAELLLHHRPPAITDVNIQTGEDPVAAREVVL
ncbi:MAG: radical SAM protein, partial [Verrucomicrobia bacterium]|nr:radical SAM protein [Verrucomicrobiota bacterium]